MSLMMVSTHKLYTSLSLFIVISFSVTDWKIIHLMFLKDTNGAFELHVYVFRIINYYLLQLLANFIILKIRRSTL